MAFMIIQMGADEAPEKVEAELKELTDQEFRLYSVPVQDWNKELSPWPAKAVFRNEDFGDGAPDTLKKVLQYAIPWPGYLPYGQDTSVMCLTALPGYRLRYGTTAGMNMFRHMK